MRENQCVANDVMNVIILQSYHGGVREGEKLLTMLLQPWGRWNRRKSEERTSKLLSKGKMFLLRFQRATESPIATVCYRWCESTT